MPISNPRNRFGQLDLMKGKTGDGRKGQPSAGHQTNPRNWKSLTSGLPTLEIIHAYLFKPLLVYLLLLLFSLLPKVFWKHSLCLKKLLVVRTDQ